MPEASNDIVEGFIEMQEKIIMVTGSTDGIGKETCTAIGQ